MNPKPDKFIPALYGGIIMALVSAIPFVNLINCLCCAGILLGGFMAIYFYKNNFTPDTPPFTAGDCVAVGAIAGVVGAVVGTILSLVFVALFGNPIGELLLQFLENSNLQIPEEALENMRQSLSEGMTLFSIIFGFIIAIFFYPLFGLLGGLIGYSVYKPKQRVIPPPPMPQPPVSSP